MKTTKLRKKFLKDRTDGKKKGYSLQLNYCLSFLCKTKKKNTTQILTEKR